MAAYVHIPFCESRCGYCDFNTYVFGGPEGGRLRDDYVRAVCGEIDAASKLLGGSRPLSSVFFGGGTPTLLSSAQLGEILGRLRARFGIADGAEVTTEANPDSVTPESLSELVGLGFNRLSLGMQSVTPHVLATLERTHTPGRAAQAVVAARAAGFGSVSLDLMYGSPGETLDEWRATVEAAIAAGPDHVSAYSLIVEEGTPLERRMRAGVVRRPDEDAHADFYLVADSLLADAGYGWYEVSNWAREGHECRHNLSYWHGADWWGFGAGAHSHVAPERWWNVRHPRAYAAKVFADEFPREGGETLTAAEQHVEAVMLALRLRSGLELDALSSSEQVRIPDLCARGLLTVDGGRCVVTRRGRLLADAVIREVLD